MQKIQNFPEILNGASDFHEDIKSKAFSGRPQLDPLTGTIGEKGRKAKRTSIRRKGKVGVERLNNI